MIDLVPSRHTLRCSVAATLFALTAPPVTAEPAPSSIPLAACDVVGAAIPTPTRRPQAGRRGSTGAGSTVVHSARKAVLPRRSVRIFTKGGTPDDHVSIVAHPG